MAHRTSRVAIRIIIIFGNEVADHLAKRGAKSLTMSAEPPSQECLNTLLKPANQLPPEEDDCPPPPSLRPACTPKNSRPRPEPTRTSERKTKDLRFRLDGVDYSSARDPPRKKPKLTCPHGLFIQEHVCTPKCCINLAPSAQRAPPHMINLPEGAVPEFPSNDNPDLFFDEFPPDPNPLSELDLSFLDL